MNLKHAQRMLDYQKSVIWWAQYRKEQAHQRWRESGYKDTEAHDEFIRHFEYCQTLEPR